jgi:hypothetical protein
MAGFLFDEADRRILRKILSKEKNVGKQKREIDDKLT